MAESIESRAAKVLAGGPKTGRLESRERATVVVTDVQDEGRYFLVDVEVPEFWRAEHTIPGQYVSAVIGTEPRFLVLANAPGEPWQFLIEPSETIVRSDVGVGHAIGVSKPEGPGYPVDRGGPILLLAFGSAVASLRPAWRSLIKQDNNRRIRLVYAEADVADLAFRRELDSIGERPNFEVDLVLPEFLADAMELGINASFSAFVCGPSAPMQSAVERLLRLGIGEQAIFTNV